jgi:hypothetical protein
MNTMKVGNDKMPEVIIYYQDGVSEGNYYARNLVQKHC